MQYVFKYLINPIFYMVFGFLSFIVRLLWNPKTLFEDIKNKINDNKKFKMTPVQTLLSFETWDDTLGITS